MNFMASSLVSRPHPAHVRAGFRHETVIVSHFIASRLLLIMSVSAHLQATLALEKDQ